MPSSSTYISIGVAIVALSFVFLIAFVQSLRDEQHIIATPSIPLKDVVLTNFASSRIHATAEEVFDAVLNYQDYTWSSNAKYNWLQNGADGVPLVGSKGILELSIEGFSVRTINLELTVLDRKLKRIAEQSTQYPSWLLHAERVQEILPVEGHPKLCEYRTWMTHQGVAAFLLILAAKEELDDTQQHCAKDLKSFIESKKKPNPVASKDT